MLGPQPVGPFWPTTFFNGQAPDFVVGNLISAIPPNVMAVVTAIQVLYDGTGTNDLITFSVDGGRPFWASAPVAGTVHTEQLETYIPLAYGQSLECSGTTSIFVLHVAGFWCNAAGNNEHP